ncbi:uncharacterized protein L199_000048 [Kwoniella botswanensis]|uniref:uncharacterized protein n=1 Tax=Kwoniella botswanensis TaxID=1268659 RepID=UPI00315D494B
MTILTDKTQTHIKLSTHLRLTQLHPKPVPCRGPWLPTRPYRPVQHSNVVRSRYGGDEGRKDGYAKVPDSNKPESKCCRDDTPFAQMMMK